MSKYSHISTPELKKRVEVVAKKANGMRQSLLQHLVEMEKTFVSCDELNNELIKRENEQAE